MHNRNINTWSTLAVSVSTALFIGLLAVAALAAVIG
jgi:hypothetical protein